MLCGSGGHDATKAKIHICLQQFSGFSIACLQGTKHGATFGMAEDKSYAQSFSVAEKPM